jgi:hypothetical protein
MRRERFEYTVLLPLVSLVALCLLVPCGLALAQGSGQRWAVLVGVNEYTKLRDLQYCVADARRMRDQLVAAGFPRENVFLLVDQAERQVDQPFRENIQDRIKSVLAVAGKEDLVLVMFSGHGVHLDGKSYFCPTEADLESPPTTMVPLDLIYRQLEASAARQKLLLVDACRNDPRPPGSRDARTHEQSLKGLSDQLKALPVGILALSSSAAGQISWEDEQQAWAKYLGQPVEMTNSIGMKLTLIPPGEFVMGSTVSAAEIHRRFPGGQVEWYEREHPLTKCGSRARTIWARTR